MYKRDSYEKNFSLLNIGNICIVVLYLTNFPLVCRPKDKKPLRSKTHNLYPKIIRKGDRYIIIYNYGNIIIIINFEINKNRPIKLNCINT